MGCEVYRVSAGRGVHDRADTVKLGVDTIDRGLDKDVGLVESTKLVRVGLHGALESTNCHVVCIAQCLACADRSLNDVGLRLDFLDSLGFKNVVKGVVNGTRLRSWVGDRLGVDLRVWLWVRMSVRVSVAVRVIV